MTTGVGVDEVAPVRQKGVAVELCVETIRLEERAVLIKVE